MARYNILRSNSTQPERRVYEVLKKLKIPFKHRWKIGKIEVDFIIGDYALEVDGHNQKPERNHKIVELGYIPLHLSNEATNDQNYLKELLCNL